MACPPYSNPIVSRGHLRHRQSFCWRNLRIWCKQHKKCGSKSLSSWMFSQLVSCSVTVSRQSGAKSLSHVSKTGSAVLRNLLLQKVKGTKSNETMEEPLPVFHITSSFCWHTLALLPPTTFVTSKPKCSLHWQLLCVTCHRRACLRVCVGCRGWMRVRHGGNGPVWTRRQLETSL